MTFEHRAERPPRGAAGPAFPGPVLLLFPLLFLAGSIAYMRGRGQEPGRPPAPPESQRPVQVPGWPALAVKLCRA